MTNPRLYILKALWNEVREDSSCWTYSCETDLLNLWLPGQELREKSIPNLLNTGLTCELIVPTMPIPIGHPADKASRADKETEHVILWIEINNYFI